MKSLRHREMHRATVLEAAFGLSVLVAACTSATPDYTPIAQSGTTAGAASGATGTASGASAGAATTGTATGSATGAAGTASGAAAGATTGTASGATTGGATGTASGATTGGATGAASGATTGTASGAMTGTASGATTGGATGTASGVTTGTASGATTGTASGTPGADAGAGGGCNWIQGANGLWSFDPTAPGKIVLFDGTAATYAMWHKENQPTVVNQWQLNADGTMTVVPSGTGQATEIQSDMKFENLCVHVEYQTPHYDSSVVGQLRGNSGVYLKSAYEMQILDSFGQPADINTCGAAYSIAKPLVVACLDNTPTPPPWNVYEIEFKSSVWSTATPPVKTGNAEFLKCALNGQVVQLNTVENPPNGFTQAGVPDAPGPQPLGLQDHLDLVSFRNVWVRVPQY